MKAKEIRWLALVALSLVVACGKSEAGSREELRAQIEAIGLPASMVELDHTYVDTCAAPSLPGPCASFVVWYEVIGPMEVMRDQLIGAMTEAGWDVKEGPAGFGVYSARKDGHMAFVVINQEMLAKNTHAPLGTKAEITVNPLPDTSD